ncbi:MAG: hypothetical protein U0P81_01710 [Holophagaceae bacterium]
MPRPPALAAVLAFAALAPAALPAQSGHLNVPAKQMVRVRFSKSASDNAITRSKMSLIGLDGSYTDDWKIPASQALVITDVAIEPYRALPGVAEAGRFYLEQAGPGGQVVGLDVDFSGSFASKVSKADKFSFTAGFAFTTKAAPSFVIEVPWTQTGENITAFGYLVVY